MISWNSWKFINKNLKIVGIDSFTYQVGAIRSLIFEDQPMA